MVGAIIEIAGIVGRYAIDIQINAQGSVRIDGVEADMDTVREIAGIVLHHDPCAVVGDDVPGHGHGTANDYPVAQTEMPTSVLPIE